MKLYIATSWRNPLYEEILKKTREMGFDVYDFKNPETAFTWEDVFEHDHYKELPISIQFQGLKDPAVRKAHAADMKALKEADMLFLLLPAGNSAHFEAGIADALGKPLVIYSPPEAKPELEIVYLEHAPTTFLNDAYTLLEDFRDLFEEENRHVANSQSLRSSVPGVPGEDG
jgi:hypothetical protein